MNAELEQLLANTEIATTPPDLLNQLGQKHGKANMDIVWRMFVAVFEKASEKIMPQSFERLTYTIKTGDNDEIFMVNARFWSGNGRQEIQFGATMSFSAKQDAVVLYGENHESLGLFQPTPTAHFLYLVFRKGYQVKLCTEICAGGCCCPSGQSDPKKE
jgi:hypothetical protein